MRVSMELASMACDSGGGVFDGVGSSDGTGVVVGADDAPLTGCETGVDEVTLSLLTLFELFALVALLPGLNNDPVRCGAFFKDAALASSLCSLN